MRKPASMRGLETLGRVRLSKYFYMRDFLMSEIGIIHGIPNIPDHPVLAIEAGSNLCQNLLDPLQETFGAVAVRSGYRAPALNEFGNRNGLNCASNEADQGGHIWDCRDGRGALGACASIVIPWFADRYEAGRHWHDLAWWIHDHLPYSELRFFPNLCAFNLHWSEMPKREIRGWIGGNSVLLRQGEEPAEPAETRAKRYADFPVFRGLDLP
ncbi:MULTISPECIES: hypothetical protein [Halocynthiibacter]|uniref:Peptidase M15 n=1 Tax=Halocynthiibacter halioticoli TaxID=2986804 RepID=A0AAE3IX29_9RHOB|nr:MULTISPECIES: hypothetical protein [Halocynthiibacter]MCV6823822.1 hypothetical protein [Halocynthiibacter halioticoli]MCW4056823.1 hypothetical protein [Halocynthiibacter sp. SDUM655004]